jgi:dTMP kinase
VRAVYPAPTSALTVRGRFVVFEGIDGSGKSTAIARVAAALQASGIDPFVTREETDTWLGEAVRRSIADKADPLTTTFLFLADRAQHVPTIRSTLEAGQHVLCDRFHHSTYAYQSVTLADHMTDPVAFLRALHAPLTLEPDHVILFDVEPATAVARVTRRSATTQYEKEAFLGKVRNAYRELAATEPERFTVLDAGQDLEAVVQDAEQATRDALDL